METEVIKIDPNNPDSKVIKHAAELLKAGKIVIYPTETCYGIGVLALDSGAVKKMRDLTEKDYSKPIAALVADAKMAEEYSYIDKRVKKIIKKFTPGPLTIIVSKKEIVPAILNPFEFSFRISANKTASLLVKEVGQPITATSANMSGKGSIYEGDKIKEVFEGRVDLILDAGKLPEVQTSTVVDLKTVPRIIREGPITLEEIKKAI